MSSRRKKEQSSHKHNSNDEDTTTMDAEDPIVIALHRMRSDIHPHVPNPAPLGLMAFGFTTFLLQVRTTQWAASGEGFDLVLSGFALFFGGLLQVIAGISEIRRNNLFGYTAFTLYGGFWMSIAATDTIKFLATGDIVANPKAMQTILALLCLCSSMLWSLTFKLNKTICVLFFFLTCTCGLLAAGVENETMNKVGGYLGMITSANAFWLAFAEMINDVYGGGTTHEIIPLGHWGHNPFHGRGGFHFPSRIFGTPGNSRHGLPKRRKVNHSFAVDGDVDEERGP